MCGIAGIHDRRTVVSEEQLQEMAKTMKHRGPDSTGFYISKNRKTGFAHNRLAIIDLSATANQPMSNEDDTVWIVFNGEIYNFQTIRKSLIKKGHRFKSKGDSEVILHLFEEKGIRLFKDLNGMFAFCLFDENNEDIFIARDRVGIKPLYYYFKNGLFAFASEIKALLTIPQVSKDLDLEGLDFYFTLGYIPQDLSIFKDIKKLRPGCYLKFNGYDINIFTYWNLNSRRRKLNSWNESDLIDALEDKLTDAVKIRMISDVPIGSFLSGGLDSSLVTKIMSQQSNKPLNTFTIGFDSAEHNETPYARIVANQIESNHKEYFVKINAVDSLEKLLYYFDEPFADASLIPTYYISKIAKEYVTVILSGDGGDELFAGYNWYTWVLLLTRLKKQFGSKANLMTYLAKLLPEGFEGKHILSVLNSDISHQFLERISFFNPQEKLSLYKNELKKMKGEQSTETRYLEFFECIEGDCIERMTITDFHYYLPEDILTKVDRASMGVSLETRLPWLDHRLIEFAYSLPSNLKINGKRKKYLTKELAKKLLPKNFLLERKQGFCIPINEWMKDRLGDMLQEELENRFISEFLNKDYVYKLLDKHRKHRKINYGAKLFSILFFSMWYRRYIGQQ